MGWGPDGPQLVAESEPAGYARCMHPRFRDRPAILGLATVVVVGASVGDRDSHQRHPDDDGIIRSPAWVRVDGTDIVTISSSGGGSIHPAPFISDDLQMAGAYSWPLAVPQSFGGPVI